MSEPTRPFATDPSPPDPMSWLRQHAQAAPAGHWDELRDRVDAIAPTADELSQPPGQLWEDFMARLGPEGLASLNPRMANLRRQVRDNGITYNVYANAEQPQRPWALDLFPLIISTRHWAQIERGVLQRMALLEHIMADAYGPQTLVAKGLLPAALVQGHPGYLHAMHGAAPVGGHYLSLAAFDLARGPDGLWWLMSQRTQAPSGLGYLLENRLIISRLFPEAFDQLPVQRLAATYQSLVDGLKARCPEEGDTPPHIALLTPGPYNETHFEHAYLARYLGLTLVQADDLTVRDEKLYLKTLQGLQRVHGLLKRVDDNWLDPLELRADSTLGVPGLLQAVRSGQLLVANTPGSGFLESNALLGFMPALAQDILGEELQLPAIPSWWCGETSAQPEALLHLPDGVVKPTYPNEGQRHGFEPQLGRLMTQRERDEWAGRILREPEAHTVQSWLPLSHLPVWNEQASAPDSPGTLETRPVILRVFAVTDEQGQWRVLPGGLARLGTHEGIASMQRGGSSADVWVQAPAREAVDPLSLLNTPSSPLPQHRQRLVTSRAAENLFWMGRYTERTENAVRLVRLGLDVLGSEDQSNLRLLQWITTMSQQQGLVPNGAPAAQQSHRVFERSLVASLWDTKHTTSVGFNLRSLVAAAASVRDRLSPEHWQMLEQSESAFWAAAGPDTTRASTALAQQCLRETSQRLAALTGAQTDRMSRDDGWRLLSIGRHIERLDFLAGALRQAIGCGLLLEQAGFDAVLKLFDSTISFHAQFQQSRTPQALVDLLVSSPDNPRALSWVAKTLRSRLLRMEHLASGATQTLAALLPDPAVLQTSAEVLWPSDSREPAELLDLLTQYQRMARQVSDGLSGLFFTHSQAAAHSVSA
ncbi:circularly permuted type 2 ATP-grasp protein [Limnohabitans radicicola]|uniref:Circularly permuted type 2 ATP-grasp protein n=1 Tax=Limnohabitans radicicola TaxID=2771427 RepID=A0A927IM23_9BURK|nr:circularly permuted type 2 ATP-grasp protein [Limnohabitans radicicola]MBD8050736.1 circularly permuted type 2 ATP-grasp protein [Limnohabitans radicicola]